METFTHYISLIADSICGVPLFLLLIGGGLYLFITSGMVSLRRLPAALRELRRKNDADNGQISSLQALASVMAATVGLGNIAGVAIALVLGGPGAIFWMWVSALVGMATKYHEGVLATMYKGRDREGNVAGGPMHIIERGLGRSWRPMALFFAFAGMFGTLCVMNANQLPEAAISVFDQAWLNESALLAPLAQWTGLSVNEAFRLLFGVAMAVTVALVVLKGIKRIARVASVLVPVMIGLYFLMVMYIILTHLPEVPGVFADIIGSALSLEAGFGGLVGIAVIGARRAALVNEAGIGTASIMHGASRNNQPVREGLIAMIGPSVDSGLVCTLTAVAILLCGDFGSVEGVQGLQVAMQAFSRGIPFGEYLLLIVVLCFGMSSLFSYSFYGSSCAGYLWGPRASKVYNWVFILTLVFFAVIPLKLAVSMIDLFYALMALPTMTALLALSPKVRQATREYFKERKRPEEIEAGLEA